MPDRPHRPRKFRVDEIGDILSRFKALTTVQNRGVMESCELIAKDYGRSTDVIYALIKRFRPTVDGAEMYMRSQALRLAMRTVRKANVSEAIDILQRSNIGVLAPKQESSGGTGGFFLSVQADTCGAVKIGVSNQPPQRFSDLPQPLTIEQAPDMVEPDMIPSPSLAAAQQDSGYAQEIQVEEPKPSMTEPGVPHPHQGSFGRFSKPREEWGKRHQTELERARQRIKEAREARAAEKYKDLDV